MNQITSQYQAAFAGLPQEAKDAVKGKTWEPLGVGEVGYKAHKRRYFTSVSCWYRPIGLVLEVVAPEFTEVVSRVPSPDIATDALVQRGYLSWSEGDAIEQTIADFIRDWDDGTMTVDELEAIFS